jgi:hypothetical protein
MLDVDGQRFAVQSWPEDPAWQTRIEGLLGDYIDRLQAMNGLDLPGGTISVREVGNSELGEFAGMYNSATKIAYLTEETGPDIVAHELSHIWYNRNLFQDKWASEGMAVYSEQLAGPGNYTLCVEPGKYPGTGTPDLSEWVILDMTSTTQDEQVLDYQYSAACYVITQLATDIGEDNEKSDASSAPLSAEAFLDMIDERGMLPAGVEDLDQAQELMADYGIFTSTELSGRSEARADYHKLADDAGNWKLPLAVRGPMASWSFHEAETAMTNAAEVVGARDEIEGELPDFSFDGTELETRFEGVATAAELSDLTDAARQEADAAAVLVQAREAESAGRNPLAMIGLLGADLQSPLSQATDALKSVRPDEAKTAAQSVLDQVNDATLTGVLRLAVLLGLMLLAFLAFKLFQRLRNRRRAVLVAVGEAGGEATAEVVAQPSGPPPEPPL